MDDIDKTQIRRLDGGLLLIFRELLACRRVSETAQRLGLSQSAVSHALARLRDVFGDPLFLRRAHGLEPTRRALELGPRVEALIELFGAVVSRGAAFDPARSRRRFGIACPNAVASLIGDRLVERFRLEAPSAAFATRPVILDRALAAVRRGELDLALGVFDEIPTGLEAEVLYEDQYCVLARRDHPTVQGSVDLPRYATVGHVFVGNPDGALSDEGPFDRKRLDATYGRMPPPDVVRTHAYVSEWETAMLIAAGSDALVECPRRLAARYADRLGLQMIDPPQAPFRFTIQAVRRSGADPAVAWLIAQVGQCLD